MLRALHRSPASRALSLATLLWCIAGCVSRDAVAVDGDPCANGRCASGGNGGTGDAARDGGDARESGGRASGGRQSGGVGGSGGSKSTGGAAAGSGGESPIPDAATSVPRFTLVVDAPEEDAIVDGLVTVRGRGPGFLNVEVWDSTHRNPALGQTTPAANGDFTMKIDVSSLARGPTTWTAWGWDSKAGEPFERTASVNLHLTIGGADAGTCSGQTCSGHGTCAVAEGTPTCTCDGGYRASELSCVPDTTTSTCAARPGATGHVAPTCVRKALFGGGFLDSDAYAQKLGRPSLDIQAQWDDVLVAPQGNTQAQDWSWVAGHFSTNQWVVQAQWPGALALAMPMWVRGQSPTLCASGQNDAQMSHALTTLKDVIGQRDVYIRLGWEFNSGAYSTQASQGDANYQKAWRDCWVRWYDVIKAVNPAYMLVWNPGWANKGACQSGYTSVLDLWPGKEFVDAAGPDQYDANWCGKPAAYDEMDGEQPIGIGAWATWVIAQGVPFAVSEWAVDSGQYGNGDRPQFIRDMYAAFKKAHESPSGLAFQMYFDGGNTYTCRHSLLDPACTKNPTASTEYFTVFKTWPPK